MQKLEYDQPKNLPKQKPIPPSKFIFNGGLEEGLLEAVNQDGLLSEKDKQRLDELKSLPRNRYEFEKDGKKFYQDIDPKEPIEIK